MTGNTGFRFRYNLAGRTSGIIRSFIIAASATIKVGDMVKGSSGYIALAANNSPILGVVVGIVDKNGINMDNSKYSFAQATWTSSSQQVVCGAANTTGDQVRALVDVDPFSVWSGETDNASTDDEARLLGCYTDLVAASDQADDDTAATTQGQLYIWGADPESDSTLKANLYSIAEHQIWQAA